MSGPDPLDRAEELLAKIEAAREQLERTDDPDTALELLDEIAKLARETNAEIERAREEADS